MSDAITDAKIEDTTTASPSEPTQTAPSQGDTANNTGQTENLDGLKANRDAILAEKKAIQLKNDELSAKLAEIETAKETSEREAAEKAGEFEKLYGEEKTVAEQSKKQAEAANKVIAQLYESQLTELPAEQKDKFEKLFGDITDPIKKLEKLTLYKTEMPTVQNPNVVPTQQKNDVEELRIKAAKGDAKALEYFKQNPSQMFA